MQIITRRDISFGSLIHILNLFNCHVFEYNMSRNSQRIQKLWQDYCHEKENALIIFKFLDRTNNWQGNQKIEVSVTASVL